MVGKETILCYVFWVIGIWVLLRICQWIFSIAQISAFENGPKAPLKMGVIIFIFIFAVIKILGYELDMEIALIYFALMLSGLAGFIRGLLLSRSALPVQLQNEEEVIHG